MSLKFYVFAANLLYYVNNGRLTSYSSEIQMEQTLATNRMSRIIDIEVIGNFVYASRLSYVSFVVFINLDLNL